MIVIICRQMAANVCAKHAGPRPVFHNECVPIINDAYQLMQGARAGANSLFLARLAFTLPIPMSERHVGAYCTQAVPPASARGDHVKLTRYDPTFDTPSSKAEVQAVVEDATADRSYRTSHGVGQESGASPGQ
jgi:hypothetical protein